MLVDSVIVHCCCRPSLVLHKATVIVKLHPHQAELMANHHHLDHLSKEGMASHLNKEGMVNHLHLGLPLHKKHMAIHLLLGPLSKEDMVNPHIQVLLLSKDMVQLLQPLHQLILLTVVVVVMDNQELLHLGQGMVPHLRQASAPTCGSGFR